MAPFTAEEAPELLGVSFVNNVLNRVTLSQLTVDETLPMMGVIRPLMQRFPNLHPLMYKSFMRPGSASKALPGRSEACRPHSSHPLRPSFGWVASLPAVAHAIAYLDYVVNLQLRGRFLPLDVWCAPFFPHPPLAISDPVVPLHRATSHAALHRALWVGLVCCNACGVAAG